MFRLGDMTGWTKTNLNPGLLQEIKLCGFALIQCYLERKSSWPKPHTTRHKAIEQPSYDRNHLLNALVVKMNLKLKPAEIFARPPMSRSRVLSLLLVVSLAMLGGCATRPINPPIEQVDLNKGYRYETRWEHRTVYDNENIVILAFSGGGTRAAAFAYGALEALRRMELILPTGRNIRILDEVDIITGVSGGGASPRWPTAYTATSYSQSTSNAS